ARIRSRRQRAAPRSGKPDQQHLSAARNLHRRGRRLRDHDLSVHLRLPASRTALEDTLMSDAVLQIRNLQKSFGEHRVLKGIDLQIGKGEVLVIIGPSGSGKSTLLRCLNFLEEYDHGE